MSISLNFLPSITLQRIQQVPTTGGTQTFGALLGHAVQSLESTQQQANNTIQQAMTGGASVTSAMVAMVQAQSSLDVATAVRNNAMQAYQTIMNMPIG